MVSSLRDKTAQCTCLIARLGIVACALIAWTVTTEVVRALDLVSAGSGSASGMNVVDRVGQFIPLELSFQQDNGSAIRMSDLFKHQQPVVVSLNYSDCPGLCIAQLENLVSTLKLIGGLKIGKDYQIVTVSIDPAEDVDKAKRTKAKYLAMLNDPAAEEGWHFLVGKQDEISTLAESLGYQYSYDEVNKRYNHPAVLYFLSSQGRLCRYLTDLGVEPAQFKMGVAEAAEGKLDQSLSEKFVQFCFAYDPEANRYSANARRVLAVVFTVFVAVMLGCLAPFWFTQRKSVPAANGLSENKVHDSTINHS